MTFQEFNFKKALQQSIDDAGFTEPSPIQADAIPVVLAGKDMVGQAHTGTGKTAAFGLPILNMMEEKRGVQALVVVPTRELAMQVADELYRFGKYLKINTATVYGGQAYGRQLKMVDGAGIVVATPGRLIDLLKGGKIKISPSFTLTVFPSLKSINNVPLNTIKSSSSFSCLCHTKSSLSLQSFTY